jgi:hypothetical protein
MIPLDRARLEKAAADCGFELTPVLELGGALVLRSAMFPESVVVSILAGGRAARVHIITARAARSNRAASCRGRRFRPAV